MFEDLIGNSTNLTIFQISIRAFLTFFVALLFIRLAGIRAFGMKSAFDNIIILLLGAILSHAVIGDMSFWGTLSACLIIVLLHRIFGILSVHSDLFGRLIKGSKTILMKDGKEIYKNMNRTLISHKDLDEGIRMTAHTESHKDIEAAYLERNGHISVITKQSHEGGD